MPEPIRKFSRTPSAGEEIQALKELSAYGYTKVSGFLTNDSIQYFLNLTESDYAEVNKNGRVEYKGVPSRDKDDKILYNLQNKNRAYLDILVDPFVRKICMSLLNDPYYRFLPADVPNYVLQYYNGRSSGQKLDLHIDSYMPFPGDRTNMMQVIFFLEDSTLENGCTVAVPGSHKSGHYTDRELGAVQPLIAKAGDLIMWDSRLWHGTAENTSGRSRWAMIATLSQWWVKPSMDIVRLMNDEVYRQCSDEQKQLLGFCSIPPTSEFERNNTKCGYDFLKPSVRDYGF